MNPGFAGTGAAFFGSNVHQIVFQQGLRPGLTRGATVPDPLAALGRVGPRERGKEKEEKEGRGKRKGRVEKEREKEGRGVEGEGRGSERGRGRVRLETFPRPS